MKSSSPQDAVRDLFGNAADMTAVPDWPSSTEPMRASLNTPLPHRRSGSPEPQELAIITGKLLEMSKMMDEMMNEMAEVKKELTMTKTAPMRMDPMQQPDADAWAAYRVGVTSGQSVWQTTPPGYTSAGAVAAVPFTTSSGSGPTAAGGAVLLRPIHPKDIKRLEEYDTVTDGWLEWSRGFINFLDRNDNRWSSLLKQVEALQGRPITPQDEAAWQYSIGLGNIADWKSQLESYLSSYTKGRAREIVRSAGPSGALNAWGILADKGHSLRESHQLERRNKAYAPRKNVPSRNWRWA